MRKPASTVTRLATRENKQRREAFALAALTGILAGRRGPIAENMEQRAKVAWEYADAMLAAENGAADNAREA